MDRILEIQLVANKIYPPSGNHHWVEYIDMKNEAFVEGVEWADEHPVSPWIGVEEQLPEPHTNVFFIVRYADRVSYYVGFCHSPMQWEAEDRIFLPNSPLGSVTHWMPIPSFNKIVEPNKDVLNRIKEKGD